MWRFNQDAFASRIHLSVWGNRNKQGKFDWAGAVLDSAIISGITLCTGLGTLASSGAFSPEGLVVLFSAVGVEFLSLLAAKRRLLAKPC